ncbi:MAG TPA: glycosyltransferase [Polyangiales bacterium]
MRVLHVAALPFPSPQGTQALLHAMLMAHVEAGHDAHLLCYPGPAIEAPFAVHRCASERPVSQRSGPSLMKVALDGALAGALPKLVRRLQPSLIIAHHVEAAAIACTTRTRAWFYAHTDLGAELPMYFAARWALPLRLAGRGLDAWLARHMPTLAVSPLLAAKFGCGVPSLPWALPAPITEQERAEARAYFAFRDGQRVALYAGNLDRYQGLDVLADALRRRPSLRWLIATESPIRAFARSIRDLLPRVRFARLHDEQARRRAHAACDLALVPRAVPGGVPIKLFDALARGVPTVAARLALAGYPLAPYCSVVDDDWLAGIDTAKAHGGRAYLGEAHDPARFAAQLSALRNPPAAARV